MESVPPLFFKNSDLSNPVSAYELCTAILRICGAGKLEGLQKVRNLWRLYPKDKQTRLELFTRQSILVRGKEIVLYDQNPYISAQDTINATQPQSNDKLTIQGLPLSLSNDEIRVMLESKGIKLRSRVNDGFIRDDDGHLTTVKSGDRFVYVEPFNPPLPRNQLVGNFPCSVIHHGKRQPCLACSEPGHRVGDIACKAKTDREMIVFKSYQHPLSNHFPCDITINNEHFKSVEHAYYWRMATELGKHDIATEIQNSKHAGAAKRIAKQIADDDIRWKWESENIDIMINLLRTKAQQCDQFNNCLLENHGKVLVEASPSLFWSSGLSPYVTANSSPQYWSGQNMLGALLMELTEELVNERHTKPVTTVDAMCGIEENSADHTSVNHTPVLNSPGSSASNLPGNPGNSSSCSPDRDSRPRQRVSPEVRPPRRSDSTPAAKLNRRNCKGDKVKGQTNEAFIGQKTGLKKGPNRTDTPQRDIRTLFEVSKRKNMESSPEQGSEAKSQKSDEVT